MIGNSYIEKIKQYLTSKDFLGEQGVTLIELLVAVGIFALVMSTTIVVFSSTIKDQQTVKARLSLIDNTRYTLDFMNKELRMAKEKAGDLPHTFTTNGSNPLNNENSSSIVFINSVGHTITYFLDTSSHKIMRNDSGNALGNQPISSDEVNINDLDFIVNNWSFSAPNPTAPIITIYVKAERTGSGGTVNLELQSTVSPRLY